MKPKPSLLLAMLTLTMVVGCGGLSEPSRQRAESIPGHLDQLKAKYDQKTKSLAARKQGSEWQFLEPYATKEKWEEKLAASGTELGRLQTMYSKDIKPLADKNDPDTQATFNRNLDQFYRSYGAAKDDLKYVDERITLLENARQNADGIAQKAAEEWGKIDKIITEITPVVDRAKLDYPSQVAEIDKRWAALTQSHQTAKAAQVVVAGEHAKHAAKTTADYAALADQGQVVTAQLTKLTGLNLKFRQELAELGTDYTKILFDSKVAYQVQVVRISWDTDYSNPTEHEHKYAFVTVPYATYDRLLKLPATADKGGQGYLASHQHGFFKGWYNTPHIKADLWSQLHINNGHVKWPDGDDEGVFAINDMKPVYYHRYKIVTGTEAKLQDWVQVPDATYVKYAEAMGMAVESKPLGSFKSQTIYEPTPPGLDRVGNERYGEWRTNEETGKSMWHYYGQYAFWSNVLGSNERVVYVRDDYNDWRRHRNTTTSSRPYGYYGRNRKQPTYGSRGTFTRNSTTFKNSNFKKAGGYKAASRAKSFARVSGRGSSKSSHNPATRGSSATKTFNRRPATSAGTRTFSRSKVSRSSSSVRGSSSASRARASRGGK